MLVHFTFVLLTFSLNAFSTAATTLHEPFDAWIKPPLFPRFKKVTFGVAGFCWSVDASDCTINIAQSRKSIFLQDYELYNQKYKTNGFKLTFNISINNGISCFWIVWIGNWNGCLFLFIAKEKYEPLVPSSNTGTFALFGDTKELRSKIYLIDVLN